MSIISTSKIAGMLLIFFTAAVLGAAQQLSRSFAITAGARIEIVNLAGKVDVQTNNKPERAAGSSDSAHVSDQMLITASSPEPIAESDIKITSSSSSVQVQVRPSDVKKRIDLSIALPPRMRVKVETTEGEVRIAGDLISMEVRTRTGTIAADVPTAFVSYMLRWTASRPRVLSDFELNKVKEKAAGKFEISGTYREADDADNKENSSAEEENAEPPSGSDGLDKRSLKKQLADARVSLNLETARGIILLNIPPNEVSSDLRERPLTNAAKAIIRSGDSHLMEAIRRAAPKFYGDYTRTLPPMKFEPSFADRPNTEKSTNSSLKVASVRVSDLNNRAIGDLSVSDFEVLESGQPRQIVSIRPSTAPFNLVLLLDVSGSVDNYVNFIRKAARNFVGTVDNRDRISIVTFNDDVKVLSTFTTDKTLLSESLDTFDAGGATAYYDALAFTLAETLRPLKGERTAIVVLTDGDDNRSFLPFDSMLSSIQESGALIYPLYVPSALVAASQNDPGATLDSLRTRYLQGELTSRAKGEGKRLADVSGGVYYEITQLSQLQTAYEDIVRQLRTAYEIEYRSELGGPDAGVSPRLKIRTIRTGTYVQIRTVNQNRP